MKDKPIIEHFPYTTHSTHKSEAKRFMRKRRGKSRSRIRKVRSYIRRA